VAIGVEHFAYVPAPLSDLPASACTHSSAAHRPGGVPRPGSRRRGRRPVGAGVGRPAPRERGEGPGPGQKAGHRLERRAAGSGPPAAEAAEGTRGRARLGLVHLVLLRASGSLPATATAHQGVPGAQSAGAGRGLLAPRAGGGTVSPSAPGTP
jgi:hypothetical protein